MRLVIDTNILVSALLKPAGPPGRILDAVVQGVIEPIYSLAILTEYDAVLTRRKFAFDPEGIAALLELVASEGWPVARTARLDLSFPDPDDRKFYECAAAAGCPLPRSSETSRRSPIFCSRCTKSSVHTFPPATFVNGQPPNPATEVSTCVTPACIAAHTLAMPSP